MYIECEHCQAGYELQLPPAALSGGRSVKFRCTSCGHSFHVVKHGQTVAESARPAANPRAQSAEQPLQHVLLRQEGVSYHVPDVATLQRWIVERRVHADDELDFGGGRWVRAGDRTDLAPFFSIVSEAETGAAIPVDELGADDPTETADRSEGFPPPAPLVEPPAAPDASSTPSIPEAAPPVAADSDADAAPVPGDADSEVAGTEPAAEVGADAALAEPATPDVQTPASDADVAPAAVDAEPDAAATEASADDAPAVVSPAATEGAADSGPAPVAVAEDEDLDPDDWVDSPTEAVEDDGDGADAVGEAGGVFSLKGDASPDSGADDTLSEGAFLSPFAAADGAALDAPDPLGLSPASSEDAPAWADRLFDDAPVPGLRPPAVDFDGGVESAAELDIELEEDEGLGLDAADLSHGAAPEADDVSQHEEEAGWFEKEGLKSSVGHRPKKKQTGGGGWTVAIVIALAAGMLIWLGQLQDVELSGGLDGPGLGVDGAPVVATGGKPSGKASEEPSKEGAEPSTTPGPDGKAGSEPPADGTADAAGAGSEGAPGAAGDQGAEGDQGAAGADAADKPAPAPARKAPRRTADGLVDRGWAAIERSRFDDAEKHFRDALKVRENHADAYFGLGYTAERRGDKEGAVPAYCKSRSYAGGKITLLREIDGRLAVLGRSCP